MTTMTTTPREQRLQKRVRQLTRYIRLLLNCCELNLDEMEPATLDLLDRVNAALERPVPTRLVGVHSMKLELRLPKYGVFYHYVPEDGRVALCGYEPKRGGRWKLTADRTGMVEILTKEPVCPHCVRLAKRLPR